MDMDMGMGMDMGMDRRPMVIRLRRPHPTTGIRRRRTIPATRRRTGLDMTRGNRRRPIRAIRLIRGRAIHRRRRKISSTSRARTRLRATDLLNIATK